MTMPTLARSSSTNRFDIPLFSSEFSGASDQELTDVGPRIKIVEISQSGRKEAPSGALALDRVDSKTVVDSPASSREFVRRAQVSSATFDWGLHRRMRALLGRVEMFAGLPLNWDGYGGVPATAGSVSGARAFIRRLPPNIALPEAMLAGSGEVSLWWESGEAYVEASFPGDGTYHFFVEGCSQNPTGDDLSVAAAELDGNLVTALTEKFSE